MTPTALAHAHATLHLHPETIAIAAVTFALSVVAWRIVASLRARKTRG